MDFIRQDVRYALRRIRQSPGFSAIIVATLALGIGANTAIFSIVDAVLLRPLAYTEPDRLVTIEHFYPSLNNLRAPVSAPGFRDYRDSTHLFESVAVQTGAQLNLTGFGEPQRIIGSQVSALFFSTLGVVPARGRAPTLEEDQPGTNRVVVLSDALWHQLFAGSDSALQKSLTLNGNPYQIIGIMPPEFRDFYNRRALFWVPLALAPARFVDGNRTNEFLNLVARVKPGITIAAAQRDMATFAKLLVEHYPNSYPPNWSLRVTSLNEIATGNIRTTLLVLLGAVGFVLLIACANVANLMLARGATRSKEVAIRTALGARGRHLVRQLITESLVLSAIGGAIGLALAFVGVRALTASFGASLPRGDEIGVNRWVMFFTLAVSVLTGLLFGLVPAAQAAAGHVQELLKEGGRSVSAGRAGVFVRRGLVVAEVALALVLLAGAGLMIRSVASLQQVDPGFDPSGVITMQLALPVAKYPSDTQRVAFWDRLLPAVAALPGVKAVGITSVLPFGGGWSTGSFQIEGYTPAQNEPGPWGDIRLVSPGFLPALGAQLTQGRFLTEQDRQGSRPVVVIDQEFAKKYFKDQNPVGKRITFGGPPNQPTPYIEIVGVVTHAMHEGLDASPRIQLYLPYTQAISAGMALVIRGAGRDPALLVPGVRRVLRDIDPDQPLAQVRSMDEMVSASVGTRRLSMILLALFAGIALTLASVGIYGVMSYSVTQRSHELGIRMALGAARGSVLTLVMRQGLLLAAIGVVIGISGGLALTRLIAAQLYTVTPRDPLTFAVVAVVLSAIAAAATLIPALRATRVDPAVVLREG